MALVALSDVVKGFGEVRAVDGVSFQIDRGEVVGFLGPNGAGKTTTMRLLTQYLEPDEGSIVIDGRELHEHTAELRRRIGYLPETNPLYKDMVAGEYISFMGRLRGMSNEEIRRRTDDVVAQTAIEDVYYRPIDQLSKGYRQRVGLAQAILSEPEILILDEPTEGLDPNQRVEIRTLITQLGEDRTVLLSTHVMQEVRRTCSRVLIINRGRLVADGAVDELVNEKHAGTKVSVELEAPAGEARAALEALPFVAAVEPDGDGRHGPSFTVRGEGDPRREIFELAAARSWPLWELHLERASLEDVFRMLTVAAAPAGETPGGDTPPDQASAEEVTADDAPANDAPEEDAR